MLQIKSAEKIETHVSFNNFFPKILPLVR